MVDRLFSPAAAIQLSVVVLFQVVLRRKVVFKQFFLQLAEVLLEGSAAVTSGLVVLFDLLALRSAVVDVVAHIRPRGG